MKKIIFLLFCLFAFALPADVKPFYFENAPDTAQQASWETLMQYKTFGAYELTFGNELIRITDKSGWIGTSKGNFDLGQNGKDTLGGPIIIGGNLTFHNGPDVISTGPLVVAGDVIVTEEGFKDRGNVFAGYQCVKGNVDPRYVKFVPEEYRFFGEDYDKCPLDTTYINDTSLTVPILKNDTAVYVSLKDLDSTFSGSVIDNKTVTINVPVGSYKEPYDIYIDKIAFSNAGKLVVKQQQGGRLTRIFLRDGITFSSFTKIVVAYCDSVGNCAELDNTDYSGTLLFYSMEDINFLSFDKSTSLQGSFISHGKISIAHHLILAGQILANNLSINTDFDGSTFLYVPFDPPVLNFDPTALASGKFVENDIPTKIDVHLDTLAKTDVLFDYCFIVKSDDNTEGYASKADFNDEIPICEESTGTAIIKRGTKTLVDDIFINVKLDGLVEDDEKLVLKVYNLQGAVLPGNVHSGFFYLTLTDGVKVNTAPELDKNQKIDPYEEEQLIPPCTGEIGKITVKDEKPNELKFELTDPSGLFTIDNTGKITTSHVFDYETEDTVYVVKVKVTDNEGLTDSANYEIKIKNKDEGIVASVNINPVYEGPIDSIIGGIVGTVTGKDGDSTVVSYNMTDPSGTFVINTSTGVITILKELDYEKQNKYPVIVSMTSTDGSKKDTSFVISVLNVNEPIHVKDTVFTIDENTTGNVGKVTAWDEDDDKIYYSVSDTVNYTISDGVLILKNPIDFETQKTDTLTIYVEDGNNMKDSAKVIIKVNNVNEPLHIDSVKTSVDENTPKGTVLDTIHGYDEDGEKITYTPIGTDITIKDSIIYLNRDVDYEKDSAITVKVIASTKDDKDTITVTIKVNNVNEPVHVKDTTLTVPENTTGPIGKVEAWDEDNDKISYRVSDSTKYSIDDNGVISVKVPFDFETQKTDSLIVYVKDPSGMTDSAVIHINVKNENESSTVEIISTETRDTVYSGTDTVYTNRPNVIINWKADDNSKTTDTTVVPGKNVIELCYKDPSKDSKACGNVVVLYSDAAPIVTVAKVDKTSGAINGLTIVEEVEKNDKNIYVNTKLNDIEVTVKDTVTGETEKFQIQVELDTVKIPTTAYEKYTYVADPSSPSLKTEFIENGQIRYTETIVTNGDTVKISYIGDKDGKPIDTVQTVSYDKIINGQKVTFSYTIDDFGQKTSDYEVTYTYTDKAGNDVQVSYTTDETGVVKKNKDGGLGYKISYTYTNKYGNSGTSEVFLALDIIPPKVKIISPAFSEDYFTNSVEVIWTVDGIEQDTLKLERLEKGLNKVIRMYKDKYGNIGADTVIVFMKNAKDIEIKIINPVTEINQEKVDEYYWKGNTYNPNKPFEVKIKNPESDSLPSAIGVGLKVNIVLPSVSPTGGLATVDDMIQVIKGKPGILVDKNGNLKAGTSTGADGSYTIPVDEYIDKHCDDTYKKEYNKNGLEHTTIWDVKYKMHIWIFNNNAEYVNDFKFEYVLDDTGLANDAGILTMVIDWLADKDGAVKAANGKNLGTGAYVGKISAVSVAKARCTLNSDMQKGTKIKKDETEMFTFGYKRPISNK